MNSQQIYMRMVKEARSNPDSRTIVPTNLSLANEAVTAGKSAIADSKAARKRGYHALASSLLIQAIFDRDVAIAALVLAEEDAKGGAS